MLTSLLSNLFEHPQRLLWSVGMAFGPRNFMKKWCGREERDQGAARGEGVRPTIFRACEPVSGTGGLPQALGGMTDDERRSSVPPGVY